VPNGSANRSVEWAGLFTEWLGHADARQVKNRCVVPRGNANRSVEWAGLFTEWLGHADARQVSDLPDHLP